jgi:hypothetical protein
MPTVLWPTLTRSSQNLLVASNQIQSDGSLCAIYIHQPDNTLSDLAWLCGGEWTDSCNLNSLKSRPFGFNGKRADLPVD